MGKAVAVVAAVVVVAAAAVIVVEIQTMVLVEPQTLPRLVDRCHRCCHLNYLHRYRHRSHLPHFLKLQMEWALQLKIEKVELSRSEISELRVSD